MPTSSAPAGAALSDQEIVSARTFDAPPERVFGAFSDPARLARWWGPKGFTSTFDEFDLRPGGAWRFLMRGPDGVEYPNENVFVEVVKPERIVFRHLARDASAHGFEMTITFAAQDGRTRITWRMRHETAEHCARVRDFVVVANEQNFDRLAAELGREARETS